VLEYGAFPVLSDEGAPSDEGDLERLSGSCPENMRFAELALMTYGAGDGAGWEFWTCSGIRPEVTGADGLESKSRVPLLR